jgi:hypothetical protein
MLTCFVYTHGEAIAVGILYLKLKLFLIANAFFWVFF